MAKDPELEAVDRLVDVAEATTASRPRAAGTLVLAAFTVLRKDMNQHDAIGTLARYVESLGETSREMAN